MKIIIKITYKIVIYFIIIIGFISAQTEYNVSIEILTRDGNIFLGELEEETDEYYKIITRDGIAINIPKNTIEEFRFIDTMVTQDDDGNTHIFRPDPNKSMYFFSPSAYPIGNKKNYCKDFCLFFPSLNYGVTDQVSLQLGAFIFPAMISALPMVMSAKYSFPQRDSIKNNVNVATGLMYISLPLSEGLSSGLGTTFFTTTIGNYFKHLSFSFGWGFTKSDDGWNFSKESLMSIAGNFRTSDSNATLFEFWKFPNFEIDDSPIMLANRFIGRKMSVDLGIITTLSVLNESAGMLPFLPMINFTFHYTK